MTHGRKYSLTSTNGHSLQRPFFFFLADSPSIHSCLNLSTVATFFCPQGGRFRKIQLYQNSPPTLPRNSANLILSHLNNRGPIFARFVF